MKLIDKSALVAEIERRIERYSKLQGNGATEVSRIFGMLVEELTEFLSFINTLEVKKVESMQENPCNGCTNRKGCVTCENGELRDTIQEEPVSEDLNEAARQIIPKVLSGEATNFYNDDDVVLSDEEECFKAGAQWQKSHLWKLADGDDLPEIDREVIVLVKYSTQRNIHDKEYFTYRVGFGHRPNPDGWDGRNIDTGVVTHYTPKLYDKGGWNVPDIAYWLDVELPKEIEL